jgi:hypothetical protein
MGQLNRRRIHWLASSPPKTTAAKSFFEDAPQETADHDEPCGERRQLRRFLSREYHRRRPGAWQSDRSGYGQRGAKVVNSPT